MNEGPPPNVRGAAEHGDNGESAPPTAPDKRQTPTPPTGRRGALAARTERWLQTVRVAMPGVLMAGVIAMAATFLSDHYGGPVMLFALLLGMAFHFLSQEGACVAGITIASRTILRIGVALLGARITAEQVIQLGTAPVVIVVFGVVLTTALGVLAARALSLGGRFGLLTGGAVAICGASAALALSSTLYGRGHHPNAERDVIFTVIGVTALSTIAMVLYPILATSLGLALPDQAGVFLGATIHDVAQVVGAGYSISEPTGDIATFVKMLRVAMLLPTVFVIALILSWRDSRLDGDTAAGEGNKRKGLAPGLLPPFLIAFAALVVINSFGLIPEPVRLGIVDISRWCLITAIAALGMKTSLQALAQVGPKPMILIVGQTLFLLLFALACVWLLMPVTGPA